jgi:hypothetical protein
MLVEDIEQGKDAQFPAHPEWGGIAVKIREVRILAARAKLSAGGRARRQCYGSFI